MRRMPPEYPLGHSRQESKGDGMMISRKILISTLLWGVADELDNRYGPHPVVPVEQVKVVAKEVVEKLQIPEQTSVLAELNRAIDMAFGEGRGK
jgi:hypothetical protein